MTTPIIRALSVPQADLDAAVELCEVARRDGVLTKFPKALDVVLRKLLARAAITDEVSHVSD